MPSQQHLRGVWGMLFGCLGIATGCATFGARSATLAHDFPTTETGTPAVYFESHDPCVNSIRAGGVLRVSAPAQDTPAAFVELKRRHDVEPNLSALFLGAFTFFLVPLKYQTDRTVIQVALIDRQQGRHIDFPVERTTSTWGGLLLFPIAPFRSPGEEAKRAEASLCDELAVRLRCAIDSNPPTP